MNDDIDISSKPFEDTEDTIKGKTGGDEYLDEAGSENDLRAEKFIKQYEKELDEVKQEKLDILKADLKEQRGTVFGYEESLAKTANMELSKLDWPEGWTYRAFATDGNPVYFSGREFDTKHGLLILLRNHLFEFSYRAISLSKDPNIDYPAVKNLVSQAENMIDSYKKLLYLTNPEKDVVSDPKKESWENK